MKTVTVFLATLAAALTCSSLSSPADAFELCVDPGAPISASTGQIALNATYIKNTGAKWARVNFILGPWTSPNDTTRRGPGNLTWKETYDQIVNSLVNNGIQVYALVGAEAVKSSAGSNLNSTQYVTDYAASFVTIVGMFKDRVRVYESFNEPNDWAGGTSSQVQPAWFAKMLREIYLGVKINDGHQTDPTWQVTLLSGPLFSHDQDTCASYLTQVYQAGRSQHGWNQIKSAYGTYPLDGFGYHIYVRQGSTSEQDVLDGINYNLNAIWPVITTYEGAGTSKKLWLSEVGWATHYISEAEQARNLTAAFNLFKNDVRVNMANWFCLVDFGASAKYGLLRGTPDSSGNKKPSYYAFQTFAQALAPTGGISGFVRDAQNNVLGSASVASSYGLLTTTTAPDGSYSFTGVAAGQVTLTASKFGYRSQQRIVNVTGGQTASADFSLIKATAASSIGAAKSAVDNSFVQLNGVVVSGVFGDRVYVQSTDRSSGIALIGATSAVGKLVNATGTAATLDGERVLTGASVQDAGQPGPPVALLMSNRTVGGEALARQGGLYDIASGSRLQPSIGLNNIGLLVKTSGKVTYADAASGQVYIDDGSSLDDGSGHAGLKVTAQGLTLPQTGHTVSITGISGATVAGERLVKLLRPRTSADIVRLSPAVQQPIVANPGFELGSASGWTLYGQAESAHSGSWFGEITAHSGSWFLGSAANEGTKSGGLYQQVAVTFGNTYSASVWSRVYHGSNGSSAAASRVGIDPNGGTNPLSSSIVWSAWDTQATQWFSEWRQISTASVAAQAGTVTLFLDFQQSDTSSWHINSFDDASVTAY